VNKKGNFRQMSRTRFSVGTPPSRGINVLNYPYALLKQLSKEIKNIPYKKNVQRELTIGTATRKKLLF